MFILDALKFGEIPQNISLEIADIYSDYLYIHSKKEELKDFGKVCAQIIGWTKESCYVIGNLFSLLKQHEQAITWFRRSLMIDPNYEAAYIVSGNEYLELKSPNEAITSFLTAISKAKKDIFLLKFKSFRIEPFKLQKFFQPRFSLFFT